jgi:hypothetical protein
MYRAFERLSVGAVGYQPRRMRTVAIRITTGRMMWLVALLGLFVLMLTPVIRSTTFKELWLAIGWGIETARDAEAGIERMHGRIYRGDDRVGSPVTCIELRGHAVHDLGFVHLRAFDRLECLLVKGCDIHNISVKQLSGLKNLRQLTVSNTWISNIALSYITNLNQLDELDVSLNPGITDAAIGYLSSFTGLRKLDLTDTGLTKSGISLLRRRLPNTKVIYGLGAAAGP